MNLLLLTTHLNKGGLSRYVLNLAKGLTQRNHRVVVASGPGEWSREVEAAGAIFKEIPIRTKSICSPKVITCFSRLSSLIKEYNIEIIHANTRVTQCLAYLLHKGHNIPYVSAFHGFYQPKLSRRLFKFAGMRSIAVSKSVKEHLITDLQIPAEAIHVVYNGIDSFDSEVKASLRQSWGFGENDFLVGMLGRISAEKGHELALEAMMRLFGQFGHLYFLISGKGKVEEKLKSRVASENLSRRVRFLDCPAGQFLDSIDVLLAPSEKEGFGFSVIEAFAKKVAVIGYNTGGIAEIIEHMHNGILFNQYNSLVLADAIEELMLKDELRNKLISQAKEDSYNFTIERMASETDRVYLECLQLQKEEHDYAD